MLSEIRRSQESALNRSSTNQSVEESEMAIRIDWGDIAWETYNQSQFVIAKVSSSEFLRADAWSGDPRGERRVEQARRYLL